MLPPSCTWPVLVEGLPSGPVQMVRSWSNVKAAREKVSSSRARGKLGRLQIQISLFRPLNEDNASTSIWAPRTLAFTSETFLLSFSLPNFHFHAVTAYDILRTRGVPLGKRDYEGRLRTRTA